MNVTDYQIDSSQDASLGGSEAPKKVKKSTFKRGQFIEGPKADMPKIETPKLEVPKVDMKKIVANTERKKEEKGKNWKTNRTDPKTVPSFDGKIERQVLLNYSTVEYLCKNIKARRGLSWILSLRKKSTPLPPLRKEAQPPGFFDKDVENWKSKIATSNKEVLEDLRRVKKNYHVAVAEEATSGRYYSKFSTVDPLLLKGNTSDVIDS